jgi:ferredoxin-NADP reductase
MVNSPLRYSLAAANRQPCYRGGPARLVCKAVIDETHDSKTFVFEDIQNRSFDFKPGQYASFKFPLGGRICSRAYSISSSPTRPHNIHISVKRVSGGLVSNWLNDHLVAGSSLEITDIGGKFNYIDIPSSKPLFLCGGSGVTPLISMLQYINDMSDPVDVVLVYFSRSPKEIIFRDELEFISKRYGSVKVHMIVSEIGEAEGITVRIGRLNAPLMQELVPDLAQREIFVCGPEGFVKAARAMARNVQVAAMHEESFGEKIEMDKTDLQGGQVHFSLSGKYRTCPPGETLLEAALNAGVWIPSSCQQGVCGSCKVKLIQGVVDMDDLGGLPEIEKADGYVLACCGRPRGAVSLYV